MSITLADAIVYLSADDTQLNSALRTAESSVLDKVGSLGKKVVLTMGAALAGAGLAVGKFLLSTIDPASDLSETINKTSVVFGDSADAILDWSKTSAEALGMSQNSALSAAATYGNLFRAMEIGEGPSAEMSQSLVELAGDLASFNNMDPTEVLDKLRAGLSGETEPLKSLGVNLNQAIIEQKAFELGIWDGVGALDAAQKAQASYALIMEQTTLAQGDFARTSDGLANQQRILKARFEDIKATLGTALLPFVTEMATRFSDFISKPETLAFIDSLSQKLKDVADGIALLLDGDFEGALNAIFGPEIAAQIMPTFQAISDWITGTMVPFVQEHWPEIKAALLGIGAALAAAGVVSIVMGIAGAIATLLSPVGLIIALVGVLAAAWAGNWGGIQEKTQAVIEWLKLALDSGMQFINDFVNGKLGILSQIFSVAWQNIQLVFQAFQAAFSGDWHRFGELLRQAWNNSWNLIKNILSTAWENIKTAVANGIESVKNFFTQTDWGQVGRNILEGIANGITNGLSIIVDAARGAAQAALDAAKGFLGIESPSTVFAKEVGEPSAEGFGKGFAAKMDSIGAGMGAEAISSFGSAPAISGGGGGGGINFTYVDQRFISLSDEYDAERILAPIFERFLTNRGYQAVRAG